MALAVKNWRQTAVTFQEEMCSNLSDVDWDAYNQGEMYVLRNKIRMLLFGLSSAENEEAECHIDKISELIRKESVCKFQGSAKAVYMVFVFVVGTKDGKNIESWPVFKVPKDYTGVNASFIDVNCRVYESWKDFLENNKLPGCEYCYPKNGKYSYNCYGNAAIEFDHSPESKPSKQVQNALDVVSAGVSFGASVLSIASLAIPVLAPLVVASGLAAAGASGYCAYRSSNTLYDRKKHKQDVSLGNKEARSCYISIAGSALGLGATAATTATVRMAQSGQVLGRTASSAVTALSGGALLMNGVGIANGLHHLIEKHKEGHLSTMDVAQFSASLLLFCHATVNFKTARSIIENSQNNILQRYGDNLGSQWKRIMFRTAVKCTTTLRGHVGGKALVIRNINHINTVDEYFTSFLPEEESVTHSHAVIVSQSNVIQIDGFEHLESLLNECDKRLLKKLLMRFTVPLRKIILQLGHSLFQTMENTRDLDLMHVVSFVIQFAQFLINLIFKGERLYVLSLLQQASNLVLRIPCDDLPWYEYCLVLFEQLLLTPYPLFTIYKLVKAFIGVLSHKTQMSRELQNADLIKCVSACGILLKTDMPHWERIIDFAKNIFDALNLKKHSSFVRILKELILTIEKKILDEQKRCGTYRSSAVLQEIVSNYNDQLRRNCVNVLDNLENSTTFLNNLEGMHFDDPEEGILLRSMESAYTMENPFSCQKRFRDREQLQLLTEEEIFEICKKTLRIDEFPENCPIMRDGLETFVSLGDTVVVIICDLHNETVVSYAVFSESNFVQNDTF